MKNKGKVLVLMLSAAALVTASVFGTMAYLTDEEAVTNTFTVGKVGLTLDELDVDNDGDTTDNITVDNTVRDQANEYHLLPGHTYIKDPTVHIDETSEDCWVFVKVENGLVKTIDGNVVNIEAASESIENGYKSVADQITANGWAKLSTDSNSSVPNVYYKKWTKGGNTDLVVFGEFKVDGDSVTNEVLANFKDAEIVVTAYAVQFDGFNSTEKTDVQNAYAAWDTAKFN